VRFAALKWVGGVAAFALTGSAAQAALLQYTFPANSTSETGTTYDPTTVDPGVTGTAITDGGGLVLTVETLTYTTPVIRLSDISLTAAPPDGATASTEFFSFTLTPKAGIDVDLTDLSLDAARGGASTPRGYTVRTSADNFASNLFTHNITTERPTLDPRVIPLSTAAFQNLTTPVTFRVYLHSPSTGSTIEFDNITVNGTAVPIPEPAALTMVGVAAAGLLVRRRRAFPR